MACFFYIELLPRTVDYLFCFVFIFVCFRLVSFLFSFFHCLACFYCVLVPYSLAIHLLYLDELRLLGLLCFTVCDHTNCTSLG